MEIIRYNLLKDPNNMEVIQRAISVIKRGGNLVYPTDIFYSLGVDVSQIVGIERLFKIKKQPKSKSVQVMVSSIDMAKELAFIDKRIERVLEKIWPGPTTVILKKRYIVPSILTAGKEIISLRIPDCKFTQNLMEKLGIPITITSANFSSQPSLTSAIKLVEVFEKAYPRPDLILDTGDLPESQPLTILDLTGNQPRVLRFGPVSKKELQKMF